MSKPTGRNWTWDDIQGAGAEKTTEPLNVDSVSAIQQLPIEGEDEPNPLADFMSGDLLAKPWTVISGNTKKPWYNPFRKKSGLLNVLARQADKNRICFKNGNLNIFTPGEEVNQQTNKFLGDFFISMIELNWMWINVIFAGTWPMSSLHNVNKQLSFFQNINNQLLLFKNVNKQLPFLKMSLISCHFSTTNSCHFLKNVNKQLSKLG